ncbi:NAD(P)H-dependent oxidoreductase [Aneurinibacillus danicus]|uniref:NAD(P)H dehydrogenase (Quinone) n=1 Tax=Aneurinibacillus danicus TaxID=267746 RepID=A0A511V9G9_9BACL|nr:NAD(P)H-dependent oxidoreductase [Aneurinibacillus danicus]GEN35594.1 NAD(P)H dehydrogenase (quinone) [Aneurinibacillus danicus]
MKILVILAHPKQGSFNHAIAKTVLYTLKELNHEVIYHDLYQEKFDPLLPPEEIDSDGEVDPIIQKHCAELTEADGIIIIHPNWWGQPPAMMKGWMDRVLRVGIAYKFTVEGQPIGLLKGKTALVFNTSNTPEEIEVNIYGDPLGWLWGKCTFEFCGVETFHRKMYKEVIVSTPEQRREWLEDVKQTVVKYFSWYKKNKELA